MVPSGPQSARARSAAVPIAVSAVLVFVKTVAGFAMGSLSVLASAIDNLVKGAAGQAVQNFNLMHGLDETLGLVEGAAVAVHG